MRAWDGMETGGPHCGGGEGDGGAYSALCTYVHESCADTDSGLCLLAVGRRQIVLALLCLLA